MQCGLQLQSRFFYQNDIFTQGKCCESQRNCIIHFSPLREFLGSWRKNLTVYLSFRPLRQVQNQLNTTILESIHQYIRQLQVRLFQNGKKEVSLKFELCPSLTQNIISELWCYTRIKHNGRIPIGVHNLTRIRNMIKDYWK